MDKKLYYIFLTCLVPILAKDEKLPLCPTNIQFFPQNLPMHCRLPRSVNSAGSPPGMSPAPQSLPSPFYQSPPSNKQPNPALIPVPPGGPVPYPFPGVPPGGPPGAPFPMPMPMMAMPGPAHKLPVIVMPFYSPDPAFKKSPNGQNQQKHEHKKRPWRRPRRPRRPRPHYSDSNTDTNTDTDTDSDSGTDTDSDTETSSDTSSETSNDVSVADKGWWNYGGGRKSSKKSGRRFSSKHSHTHKSKKKHSKRRRDLLTPVLQYVTKDGYVIFEKRISKGEAKDWLNIKKDDNDDPNGDKIEEGTKKSVPIEDDEKFVILKEHDSIEEKVIPQNNKSKENIRQEVTTGKTHHGHKKHHQHTQPNTLLTN